MATAVASAALRLWGCVSRDGEGNRSAWQKLVGGCSYAGTRSHTALIGSGHVIHRYETETVMMFVAAGQGGRRIGALRKTRLYVEPQFLQGQRAFDKLRLELSDYDKILL